MYPRAALAVKGLKTHDVQAQPAMCQQCRLVLFFMTRQESDIPLRDIRVFFQGVPHAECW